MATALEIVRGISQVMANSHDGAMDEEGGQIKIGLNREEEVLITDKRVMDGFGYTISGNRLRLSYHSECRLKDVHDNNKFEGEMESMINKIKNFITKEYKKVTGDALTLTKDGEVAVRVDPISMVRTDVRAVQHYTIGKMPDVMEVEGGDRELDPHIKATAAATKKYLATGKDQYPGVKKAKNIQEGANDKDPAVKRLKDMYKTYK